MVNMRLSVCAVAAATISAGIQDAEAHSRFMYPPPRDLNTGIKSGPCGPNSQPTEPTVLTPGWHTFAFVENIYHAGTPWRLSISEEGVDGGYESCVILNHIPHFDGSRTTPLTPFRISVLIPDIDCKKCTIQMLNAMTDKIQDASCTYDPLKSTAYEPGLCFSNYHSCADITITGTTPRNDASNTAICQEPANWPFRAGQAITTIAGQIAAEPLVFSRGESTLWDEYINAPGLPAEFRTPAGPGATATDTIVPPPVDDGPVPPGDTGGTGGTPGAGTTPTIPATNADGSTNPPAPASAGGGDDDLTMYIAIGGGGAVVLGGVAYVTMRGRSSSGGPPPMAMGAKPSPGGVAPGWKQASDPVSGRTYYYNAQGQTSWTPPQ